MLLKGWKAKECGLPRKRCAPAGPDPPPIGGDVGT